MTGNEMFLLKRGCGALGLEEIAKDIQEKKDNDMAMEFTKCIGELLRKNGVVPKMTEYTRNFETDYTFETRYGVSIDELDFTEHDKVFEDKIAKLEKENKDLNSYLVQREQDSTDMIMELKQRISELESKETESVSGIDTSTPIDCANSLINHLTHLEAFLIAKERYERTFDIDDLEQIAEHLLVYCRHNKESEQ